MPTISSFFGIAIRMYYVDHPLPHIHASYAGDEATIDTRTGEVIEGYLPIAPARQVKQWTLIHVLELEANWERARAKVPLVRITGLDAD